MNDKERIESVIQLYIDSMNDSDPAKVKQAFYGSAKVVGYLHDDFMEMTVNDFAGFVIKNPVQQQELITAVETLINSPEKRSEFGNNGKEYAAQKFSPTINMGKIENIYQALLPKN